jgi:chaperonin GroES
MRKKITTPPNFPKPIQDRIIITAEKPETTTQGGIIIPECATENQNSGYVLAIGPWVGKRDNLLKIEVGDLVTFGDYCDNDFPWEGKDYLIIREADVLFKL